MFCHKDQTRYLFTSTSMYQAEMVTMSLPLLHTEVKHQFETVKAIFPFNELDRYFAYIQVYIGFVHNGSLLKLDDLSTLTCHHSGQIVGVIDTSLV